MIERQNGYALAPNGLLIWLAATIMFSLALIADLLAAAPISTDTWLLWARYTARLSFFFFLAVYLAGPLYDLAPAPITLWLRQHRRNAGISFGLAHTIHLGALIAFLIISGEPVDAATVIVGGGAYLAMFAMLATSNDAAIRRMGQTNWRRLHKFGAHYLAFVFVFTYTSSLAGADPKPLILNGLIWAAILLRVGQMMSSKARSAA